MIAFMAAVLTTSCGDNTLIEVASIELNSKTLTLEVGQTQTLTATVLPADLTDKSVTWTSSNASVASVVNGVVTANSEGTATITATAGNQTATCEVTVTASTTADVGVIINGIKWATRNVDTFGKFAARPESYGMLYQWNRPTAWNNIDEIVTGWTNSTPSGNTWSLQNDPCPDGWRVPNIDELRSLIFDPVKVTWDINTPVNGINGVHFIDVATGNNVFLPLAGYRDKNGILDEVSVRAYYWSSTMSCGLCAHSWSFSKFGGMPGTPDKTNGFSVRCVAE